jgi:hypothetical protein
MAKSKQGSKRLQKIVAKGEPQDIDKIVGQIAASAAELMMDKFGNYMCQALFQFCSAEQRLILLRSLRPSLIKVSKHPVGTHSLQCLAALASLPAECAIYEAVFKPYVISLATHPNASHTLQILASALSNRSFIALEVATKAKELAMDQLGLCLVKKCMFSREVVLALLPHTLTLSQDAYGNYAIQELLSHWGSEFCMAVGYHLQPHVVRLSSHKFASNVIEKCIKFQPLGLVLARALIDSESLGSMLGNMFGCYVLRAIAEQLPTLRSLLKSKVRAACDLLPPNKLKARQEQIAVILDS